MSEDTIERKGRKAKWATSYSTMTIEEAEKRLGILINKLKAMPLDGMLANAKHLEGWDADVILKAKKKVYEQIVQYLEIEGYLTEVCTGFKEGKLNDLVYSIISPILAVFRCKTGRGIRLEREKEIISTENETGVRKEFVVMDRVSVTEERFVLIIEGIRSSAGEAMKQCLLSMKDMRDNNGTGVVYGFVTTGDTWQMLRNDGTSFQLSEKMHVLFYNMGEDRETWMKDYSVLVDCMFCVLSNGGTLPKRWFLKAVV
ncbi:hypothetical protein L873DRAFT_1815520, partial [Choiromyces venosus 120613-1]